MAATGHTWVKVLALLSELRGQAHWLLMPVTPAHTCVLPGCLASACRSLGPCSWGRVLGNEKNPKKSCQGNRRLLWKVIYGSANARGFACLLLIWALQASGRALWNVNATPALSSLFSGAATWVLVHLLSASLSKWPERIQGAALVFILFAHWLIQISHRKDGSSHRDLFDPTHCFGI